MEENVHEVKKGILRRRRLQCDTTVGSRATLDAFDDV